jgi:hypothetical protein
MGEGVFPRPFFIRRRSTQSQTLEDNPKPGKTTKRPLKNQQGKEAVKQPRLRDLLLSIACVSATVAIWANAPRAALSSAGPLLLVISAALLGTAAGAFMDCPRRGALIGFVVVASFFMILLCLRHQR